MYILRNKLTIVCTYNIPFVAIVANNKLLENPINDYNQVENAPNKIDNLYSTMFQ